REVDETGIDLAQILPSAFQPFDRARTEIFKHDVGVLDQPVYDGLPFRTLQINGDRTLVAVVGREETRGKTRQSSGGIAIDGFDLDDVCAQIGEQDARTRPHDGVAEIKNLEASQGFW